MFFSSFVRWRERRRANPRVATRFLEELEGRRLLAGTTAEAIMFDTTRIELFEGETVEIGGTFEPPTTAPILAEVTWSDFLTDEFEIPAGSSRFSFAHDYAPDGKIGVTVTEFIASVSFSDEGEPIHIQPVKIDITNAAPVIVSTTIPTGPLVEGQEISLSASATDAGQDPLRYLWKFGDGKQSLGSEVTHVYQDAGIYSLTLTVTDDDLAFTNKVFEFDVRNLSPSAVPDHTMVFARAVEPVTGNVLENDAEPGGGLLTVVAFPPKTEPDDDVVGKYGVLNWEEDGQFSYLPDSSNPDIAALGEDESLQDVFTYALTDGESGIDNTTLTVTLVGSVPPVEIFDGDESPNSVDENSEPGTTVGITAETNALAGLGTTFSLTDDAGGRFQIDAETGVVAVAASGLLDFEDANLYTITVLVTTSAGDEISADFSLAVLDVNEAPTAVQDGDFATDEDSLLEIDGAAANTGLLSNDTDPEGDQLSVTEFDAISERGAAVAVRPNGSFEYDPAVSDELQALAPGEVVTDTFNYTIEDAFGLESSASVQIAVSGVADAPQAADDSLSLTESSEPVVVTAKLLENDDDPDTGAELSIVSVDASETLGIVTFEMGEVTYDPAGRFEPLNVGETAKDTFRYTIQDQYGMEATAEVTMIVFGEPETIPPRVLASSHNLGEERFHELTSVEITFDEDVSASLDLEDLQIRNETAGRDVFLDQARLAWDADTKTARWDLSEMTLPKGRYSATLLARRIQDLAGNELDANGDGTPGDDHRIEFLVTWRGDADLDLDVDFGDFALLAILYGQPGEWAQGDFDNDGDVGFSDFVYLANNFGEAVEENPPATSPNADAVDEALREDVEDEDDELLPSLV